METASKDANRKRGRPVTGNAVSDADRMRAYRARKKAQVLAERLAAGLPPPRPGRLGTRPAKPAVADPGMQAKIAELEAAPDGHFKIPHLWPPKIPQAGPAKL